MDENRRTKSNPWKRKIDQGIRRSGFDENFINAIKFHLEVIKTNIETSNVKSEYDYCNLLMSKLFIDKIDQYPGKKFKCQVNEYSGWPVPLLPIEVFGESKLPDEYRKASFYECLKVGDVLDCRVSSVLPDKYHLRVIHKYGVTRILDDLNIIVVMPRTASELLLLQNELLSYELIRVAVSKIIKEENERYILVTVCNNNEEPRQSKPQLGRISEEQLPPYVLDPPESGHWNTYSDYLKSLPSFRNPLVLNNIFEGFGIDPRGVYSFLPNCESLKPVDANALLKDSKLNDVKYYTDLALEHLEKENVKDSLTAVHMAIQMYPKKNLTRNDKVELCKLHEIKGKIHSELVKPKISQNAIIEWKHTLSIDPEKRCGSIQLSKIFYQGSEKYYKKKEYKNAAELAEGALRFNKNNVEASALLEHLKKMHSEIFVNLDEESLLSLEEKKKELVSELKKFMMQSWDK